MTDWQDYAAYRRSTEHTVVGTLKVLQGLFSPQLDNRRDILVYLPPSYAGADRRYPVIYMHDGQNLFDRATSFVGEWQVDETLEALSGEGWEAIVVGIPHTPGRRWDEYSPFHDAQKGGGLGDAYLAFVVETLKPVIDLDFRTRPDRAHTGILGSSMGGLISLYAFFQYPEIFGFAGVMSPAVFFAHRALLDYVKSVASVPGKLYLDVGTRELSHQRSDRFLLRLPSRRYCADVRRLRDLLTRKGYRLGQDLLYVEEPGAPHHESAWARRLPNALRFLLADQGVAARATSGR
jgi:predicted alpha/beta superfamily hydrolase